MTTIQAKQTIDINDYLQRNGYTPLREKYNATWYASPFREEKVPSFMVNKERNTFIDWGTGQRGTIIDLAILLYDTDVSGALEILSKYREYYPLERPGSFSFKKQVNHKPLKTISGTIEKINNPKAITYLEKRGIKKKI